MNRSKPPLPRLPIFMMLFISIFGFIGVAVLIFLWSPSPDTFGAPPLFFRVFGSLIALGFMALGFGLPISALLARSKSSALAEPDASIPESSSESTVGYRCPHCGAGLGQGQEVSPKGDVKCGYCHKWWNIHGDKFI